MIRGGVSTWAQYTIEVSDRDGLAAHLKTRGCADCRLLSHSDSQAEQSIRVYPKGPGGLPVSEAKAGRVISLPMHPYLEPAVQDQIIEKIRAFNGGKA